MANKLKNIHLTKVDFVDEGANQRADIKLAKRNDESDPAGAQDPEEFSQGLLSIISTAVNKFLKKGTVEKGATSFEEQIHAASVENITDEIWNVTYAIRTALTSAVCDMELDSNAKTSAMTESLAQFNEAMQGYIPKWCSGQTADIQKAMEEPGEAELAVMKRDHESLGVAIEKAYETKGELEDMLKIDKSKMTPEERAAYDEMIKKYAVNIEEEPEGVQKSTAQKANPEEDEVVEEDEKKTKKSRSAEQNKDTEGVDLLKGVIADLRNEVASLKETALTREIEAVAAKYESLGKKKEEIVESLKKAKTAGVYDEMISAYDSALAAQEASGIFGEIGKSRSGDSGAGESEAIAKANVKVAELRKNNPNLTEAQALDQVLLNDAELRREFDN